VRVHVRYSNPIVFFPFDDDDVDGVMRLRRYCAVTEGRREAVDESAESTTGERP